MAAEPEWEWKWEYLDGRTERLQATAIWMTDAEAADWHGYEEPTSRKLEETRRERGRNDGPEVEPPAGNVDWTRERRQRAQRSRYGLPPFVTPLYEELRRMYATGDPVVRRLVLEIQTDRYAYDEMDAMVAEAYFYLTQHSATLADAQKALARIRRRLTAELQRIGPVAPKRR